jgi:hypothetical protein
VGFGQNNGSTGLVSAIGLVILTNPSPKLGPEGITAQFTAYDSAGQVLGTGSGNQAIMRAGQTSAVAASIFVAQKDAVIANVKVQVAARDWVTDPHPDAVIETRNVRFVAGQYGFDQIVGELVSHYASDLKNVIVVAVCQGADGNIKGGGFTFVNLLPGGGTTGLSISPTTSPGVAGCDAYASPSNLS